MEQERIDALCEQIRKERPYIAQIAVRKGGKQVWSTCFHNFKEEDCVHVMSVTKSIVSLLIGIAMDQGKIASLADPVLKYFPDYTVKRGEKTIYQVTLRHLLTMTAPYKYKSEPWTKVCTSDDWCVAALDLLGGRAGLTEEYRYSTLGIQILCGVIEHATGEMPLDFAEKYLLSLLGIKPRKGYLAETAEEHKTFMLSKEPKDCVWFVDPRNAPTAGYGLCLSAVEMAKVGQMCLNRGVYENQRIVSEKWLAESTRTSILCDMGGKPLQYGYLWWVMNDDKQEYAALGNSGNAIYIDSEHDLVIAVAATFKPCIFDMVDFIKAEIVPLWIL